MPADTSFASVDFHNDASGQNLIAPDGITPFTIGVTLTNLTTGAVNIINGLTLGYRFAILAAYAIVGTPGTGTSATQAIHAAISGVAITGGVVTPTLTLTATTGTVIAGTAVTADGKNIGSATDTLSIIAAAGGTVFTAGTIHLYLQIQNLDA